MVAFDFGSVKFDFEGNGFIKSLNKLVTKYKSCWYNFLSTFAEINYETSNQHINI